MTFNAVCNSEFTAYVEKHCPNYSIEDAMLLVKRGAELFKRFALTEPHNSQTEEKKDAEDMPERIPLYQRTSLAAPFAWYLMYKTVLEEGKGFKEGTFVVHDPAHRIVNFFKSCSNAYRRCSSHYIKRVPVDRITAEALFSKLEGVCKFLRLDKLGLDLSRFRCNASGIDIAQNYKSGLPSNKGTIVFEEVAMQEPGEYAYFKIEDEGLSDWKSALLHTLRYVKTRPPVWMPSYFGNHNDPDCREEDPHPHVIRDYKQVVKYLPRSKQSLAWERFSTFGHAAIFHTSLPQSEELAQLRKRLSQKKHAVYARGNEVIIK